MELSSGRELELQGNDLEDLASHPDFRKDIRRSKRWPDKYLLYLARKYWITDLAWLRFVIKTWNGRMPLPTPAHPDIDRKGISRYDLWRKGNGVLSVDTCSYEASPRMLWRRLLTVDRVGSKWLVLRVRLFPGLHASSLKSLVKESLEFAWHHPAKNKKSTKAIVARQRLNSLSDSERSQSDYRIAQSLKANLQCDMGSAKKYVRAWRISERSGR